MQDHPKVKRIRLLSKLCPQYIPMLEAYDKWDMELPDLLYQFALMEIERHIGNFNWSNQSKDENRS